MALAISRGSSDIDNAGELSSSSYLGLGNSFVSADQAVTVPVAFSNYTGIKQIVYDDTSMKYLVLIDNIYATKIGIPGFMFVQPEFLTGDNSTFYLHCNATAPSLNFVINNLAFLINAMDLKRRPVPSQRAAHVRLQDQQFVACTKVVL
ncbi:hypothetical protein MMC17_004697 [Xylographa soralifera]|nr:hypothetical protein [Xylographa soralifera]